MIFFDTETCGFHGPIVLIQWARDNGEIHLHEPWRTPVKETLELIEMLVNEPDGIVGFNLAFDWFHVCQMYTTLLLLKDKNKRPDILEYAMAEPEGRNGPCLKPVTCLDLMMHARKGPYQSTMDRKDIRIKKVPTAIAEDLCRELDARIPLKDVYFARLANKKRRWQVQDIEDDLGNIIPDFKDIILKFAPSSALKALAEDALEINNVDILLYGDIDVSDAFRPVESGFAPFALAPFYADVYGTKVIRIPGPENWWGKWPQYIEYHIDHWAWTPNARTYAWKDVDYTRRLYYYFKCPPMGDTDSILTCQVGAARWRGYAVDLEGIKQIRNERYQESEKTRKKFNFNSTDVCQRYLFEVMSTVEKEAMRNGDSYSTSGIILEEIAKWVLESICEDCNGSGCNKCNNEGLVKTETQHPAAIRAKEILEARHNSKEIEVYDKIIFAGRLHASFKVIGTLSSRMSGADGINPQGIKSDKKVRAKFPLAFPDMVLCGGDFDGFEVSLVDAVYGDPDLRKDLLSGKKVHGLFGICLFPDLTYDQLLATSGLPGEKDKYKRSKNGVFCLFYMGEAYSLQNRVGIPESIAEEAYQMFIRKYKTFGNKRKMYADMFCSMRQIGGIGTRVIWEEPKDYVESMLGFRRYFTLENTICKTLYQLAEKPPAHWLKMKFKVRRRDREQTASGATRSALFAAAFAVQSANMRAAGNHVIQSPGGQITKELQARLWTLQPCGIGIWVIQPMNVHDEIESPMIPKVIDDARVIVESFIEEYKEKVPLLSMTWKKEMKSWADK